MNIREEDITKEQKDEALKHVIEEGIEVLKNMKKPRACVILAVSEEDESTGKVGVAQIMGGGSVELTGLIAEAIRSLPMPLLLVEAMFAYVKAKGPADDEEPSSKRSKPIIDR